jgi:superfamily I DNA/RNA helicase
LTRDGGHFSGAKGLEWAHTFVPRLNEGECPLACSSDAALEEERRLACAAGLSDSAELWRAAKLGFGEAAVPGSTDDGGRFVIRYVALSRARARLYLSHISREPSGEAAEPSRFLRELGRSGAPLSRRLAY